MNPKPLDDQTDWDILMVARQVREARREEERDYNPPPEQMINCRCVLVPVQDPDPEITEAERAALMEHGCINGHVWRVAGIVTKAGLTSRGEPVELAFSEEHCTGCKLKRWTHLPDSQNAGRPPVE